MFKNIQERLRMSSQGELQTWGLHGFEELLGPKSHRSPHGF